MNEHDPHSEWLADTRLREARETAVPADFSKRVMAAVHDDASQRSTGIGIGIGAWLDRPWLRAGAFVAASLLLLVRLGAVFGVLWPR